MSSKIYYQAKTGCSNQIQHDLDKDLFESSVKPPTFQFKLIVFLECYISNSQV